MTDEKKKCDELKTQVDNLRIRLGIKNKKDIANNYRWKKCNNVDFWEGKIQELLARGPVSGSGGSQSGKSSSAKATHSKTNNELSSDSEVDSDSDDDIEKLLSKELADVPDDNKDNDKETDERPDNIENVKSIDDVKNLIGSGESTPKLTPIKPVKTVQFSQPIVKPSVNGLNYRSTMRDMLYKHMKGH